VIRLGSLLTVSAKGRLSTGIDYDSMHSTEKQYIAGIRRKRRKGAGALRRIGSIITTTMKWLIEGRTGSLWTGMRLAHISLIRRTRWRNTRAQMRTREYQEDVRDRQAEQEEIKALERESEEFLKRQMEEMSRLEEEQKGRGLLTEDAAPIKLDLAAVAPAAATTVASAPIARAAPLAPPPAVFGGEDDEEDIAADKRKQRTFVKLDYDESAMAAMTEPERAAMQNAQLLNVRNQISRDRRSLWGMRLDWEIINDVSLHGRGHLATLLMCTANDKGQDPFFCEQQIR
jgi:hypothetical protein